MGYERYSDEATAARVQSRVDSGRAAVASYTADIESGKVKPEVHPSLNPHGIVFRESRDSANHPESVPVILVLDQTGSMGRVVRQIQASVRSIMKLLVSKEYLKHPHVMVIGVGDYPNREVAPLQVSQFEADDKIEEAIDNLFIEARGGGQLRESYQNAAYVAGYKTKTDHWERRGRRGYMFIIGDEMNHPLSRGELTKLIGTDAERNLQDELSLRDVYDRVLERYHTFFVLPRRSMHGASQEIVDHWSELLGPEAVLRLEDESGAGELIAAQIALVEGKSLDEVVRDVEDIHKDAELTRSIVRTVRVGATTRYESKTSVDLVRLPPSAEAVRVKRL